MTLKNRRRPKSDVLRHLSIRLGFPVCIQILVFLFVSFVCVKASVDPTSFACTTYNSTVIQLSWSMATDVSVAGYYLYLQRTDGLKTQEGPGITLSARNYISYTFYGLSYFAQYDISINSYSNLGINNTVYTQTCTTLSDIPDLSNFNLTCEGISYYEISCTWGSLDAVYWNGVPYGWQLGYISYYNDEYTYVNFNTTATLAYTIQNLQFDTKYLINIRSVNTGGFMGPYSSTNTNTLGWSTNTENATRYFCYEAIPGYIEFGWQEMPCTIYSGTIAGLLLISLLLLMLCCCMCCCKGGSKDNSKTEINIFNEENNEYYGEDDDDDDYEESEEEEVPSEHDKEGEYDDISDGDESPDMAPAIAKKKKLSDDEQEDRDVEESEEEIEESSENDEDSETDVEIYAGLTEDEKTEKKEERAAAKKKKKEDKAKKREEAKKRKEEEKKRKEEERKEKIRERMKKRNAAMAGAATVKTIDETKKEKKSDEKVKQAKKKISDSEDDESEGYYEDWNPDADENPDVVVNKVSNKDTNTSDADKKSNLKDKKKNKNKDKKETKDKSAKSKTGRNSVISEDMVEDSEVEYDDEDEYDEDEETDEEVSSEEEDTKIASKVAKTKAGKNPRKDSGRGSASSNNSVDENKGKTNKSNAKSGVKFKEDDKEPKKKGGFLSNLFGSSKPKENISNTNSKAKTVQKSGKKVEYGDWDDDDADFTPTNTGGQNASTVNKDSRSTAMGGKGYVYTDNNSSINANPVNNHDGNITINAPIFVNSDHSNGSNSYGANHFQNNGNEMPPPGYGRNPNGTFHPLPGNFNRNVPQGYIRNSDGSIQQNRSHRSDNKNTDNNPPPGYAKNFDGSFYPVRGNINPVVPPGYIKNPDGTIYKNPQSYTAQGDNSHSSNPPPGFGKNPDGTFYPLPGNVNPSLPPGFERNHDGTIYRSSNHAPYTNTHQNHFQNSMVPNEPPLGYNKNPDGTFYPKPGNRNPTIPPGYTKNPDGSIYKTSGTSTHNNQLNTTNNQNVIAPAGYGQNLDGTYRPLPGNNNSFVPPGFAKDNHGNIYRSLDPAASKFTDVPPPQGYAKNPDGSFRPLASYRNPVAPPGFIKNPDGSIFHDPYQNTSNAANISSFGPPPGYGTTADGTYFPLPSNRNPAVPSGFVKNPNGTISKAPSLSKQPNLFDGNKAPPAGYAPTTEGTYRPLPGNRNPVVPRGYMRNSDGSIQQNDRVQNAGLTNTDIPSGYTRNPDGTFRPLPENRNPIVPSGFTKNPDGTIRRNRANAFLSNNNIPPGYGKNADGTFYPLKSNPNPIVPEGFRKNPDGTIARLPQYKNNPVANTNYPATQKNGIQHNDNAYKGQGYQNRPAPYPYGPTELDPPNLPDERDKFNDLFAAKAKRKAAQKRTIADRQGNMAEKSSDLPANYNGDGEDIFAHKQNGHGDQVGINQNPKGSQSVKGLNPYGDPLGSNQNPYGNAVETTQNQYLNAVGTNTNPFGNALGTTQNPYGNVDGKKLGQNRNATGSNENLQENSVRPKENAVGSSVGNTLTQSKLQPGQNHLNPHNQSTTRTNTGVLGKPLNGNNNNGTFNSNLQPTGLNEFGNQQNNPVQNRLNPPKPRNTDDNHRGQPNEGNNPNDIDNQGFEQHENPSKRDGRQPFSYRQGKQVDTVHSNRKPISFRDNDPRYEEYTQRQPNTNNHGDASDTEVLPDDGPPNKRRPVARFRGSNQSPAWGSKPDNNDKIDKSGKKTPITELTRQDRQELIEPEPVLGSDRIGNKFPFLNIERKRESISAGNKGGKKDIDKPENRRKSESELVLRGREVVDKKDLPKRDFPPLPNTLSGEAGAIAKSDDLAGLKPETRAQIFYGFGVGRWRQAAAKWLTKWKMKKKPVKTAKASWD